MADPQDLPSIERGESTCGDRTHLAGKALQVEGEGHILGPANRDAHSISLR